MAFFDLINDRSMFMGGVGGIYWTSINKYIEHLNVDEDTASLIASGIRMADSVYTKFIADKGASQAKSARAAMPTRQGRKAIRGR